MAATPAGSSLAGGIILPAALAVAALAYLAWFAVQSERRIELLRLAAQDPFSLIAEWFGPAGTPLGIFDRVPGLAMASLVLLAAYGLGRLAVDRLRLAEGCNDWERGVFAPAVGLCLISTGMLVVGLAGGLHQAWLLWVVMVAAAGVGGWKISLQVRRKAIQGVPNGDDHLSAIRNPHSAIAWIIAPFAAILLLGACLPPWDFDVREYHLQVPKEWLQQGHISLVPHNVYGNMPLAAEMHALLPMALWPGELGWFYGALAGKVVIASFALLTAAAVAAAGHRIAGKPGAIVAGLVAISHPWLVHVSVSGLNDGVLACYVFLALYSMWLARSGRCSYLLAGLFAGAAAATKYPGLAFAVVPVALWATIPVGRISNPSQQDGLETRPTVVFALVLAGVCVGGGAWYAKNAILAGNPVYPLAYGVLGGAMRTPEKAAQWDRAHQVPRDQYGWRYSPRQLADSMAQVAGKDDLASPLILPLLMAASLAAITLIRSATPQSAIRNPNLAPALAIGLLWLLAVWWLFSHRLDRFLLPAWPIAALVGAAALRIDERWWRRAITAVVALGALYSLLAASSQLVGDNRWFVSLEQLRRDGPWPEGSPLRIKPGHQLLLDRVKPGEAVLLVGDAEPFDLPMRAFYNTCFDDCLLCDWMLGRSVDQRRAELTRRKIAWLLVDWPEIARYRSPGNYGFDLRFDPRLIEELVEQGILGRPQTLTPLTSGQPRGVEIYPVIAISPQ